MSSSSTSSLEHAQIALQLGESCLFGLQPPLQVRDAAVLQLGGLRVVAGSLGLLDLGPRPFEVFLDLSSRLDGALLLLPVSPESVSALLQIGQLSLQTAQAFTRGLCRAPF